jgi:hypothetical protein
MRRLAVVVAGLVAVGFAVAGCAGYSIQKDGCGPGYDVYTPEPYLLRKPIVASGNLVGFQFDVVWLPNYQKRYRVHAWAGLGKAHFKFTFAEGWQLTAVDAEADNTEILKQFVDLTKHLVPAGAAGGQTLMPEKSAEALGEDSKNPILYKIEFDCRGEPVRLRQVCACPCTSEIEDRVCPPPPRPGGGPPRGAGGKPPPPPPGGPPRKPPPEPAPGE